MECPQCHLANSTKAKFCIKCGSPLPADMSATIEHDRARVQDLLQQQQYAAVLAMPESSDDQLREYRAQAQQHFDAGVDHILVIYRQHQIQGPPSAQAIAALQPYYRDEIEAIDDPIEADAYARALLDRAQQALATDHDADAVRTLLYAASTLPVLDRAGYNDRIWDLLTQVEPVAASYHTLPLLDLSSALSEPVATSENGATSLPVVDSHPTQRLDLPSEIVLPGESVAAGEESDPALEAIVQLETLLQDRADQPTIQAQMQQAEALVDEESPYYNRLQRANAQQQALLAAERLDALLARPLEAWLAADNDLEAQTAVLLGQIEAAFDVDSVVAHELRDHRDQVLQHRTQIQAKITGLAELEGQALDEAFTVLERELPPGFPLPVEAQQRRQAYVADRRQYEIKEKAQRDQAQTRDLHRQLRVRMDNLFLSPLPQGPDLIDMRNEAQRAAHDRLLEPQDDPLDPSAFAYYDLLYASRFYDVTRPSEKAEAGQTAVNSGDLLTAYQKFKEDLADALEGDNPEHRIVAEQNLRRTRLQLTAKIEDEVRAALADAESRLARYDYGTVIANLEAQLQNVGTAGIEIDVALSARISALVKQANAIQASSQQVEDLRAQAEALIASEGSEQQYPRALTLLEQAQGIAPWLDSELAKQIEQIRGQQNRFIDGLIRRAEIARLGSEYTEAEALLRRAETNAAQPEHYTAIEEMRIKIFQQQEHQRHRDELLQSAEALSKEAEQRQDLDLLAGRVAAERLRIGPVDQPNLDTATWSQISVLLDLAEQRLNAWKDYQQALSRAEQAALLGEQAQLDEALRQMSALTAHRFLPIEEDLPRIRRTSRISSRVERVRQLLGNLREELDQPNHTVAPERIQQALWSSEDFQDEDIVADRKVLERLYPLYLARNRFSSYAEDGAFAEITRDYTQLSPDLQHDPVILRIYQAATQALARKQFDQHLQALLRRLRPFFEQGWDNPRGIQEAVAELRGFADSAQADQRSDTPRLMPAVLDQLEGIASQLSSARTDFDQERYPEARRRLKLVLQALPSSEAPSVNGLYPYYAELKYLREQVQDAERQALKGETGTEEDERAFKECVQSYTRAVSDPKTGFNTITLQQVMALFTPIVSQRFRPLVAEYTRTLEAIIDLVQQVNGIEEQIVESPPAVRAGQAVTAQSSRKQQIEAKLNDVLNQSREIRKAPQSLAWIGIAEDAKYQALRSQLGLVGLLDAADRWLAQASAPKQPLAQLQELLNGVEELQPLDLSAKTRDELLRSDLGRLAAACEDRWSRVLKRSRDIHLHLDRKRKQRRRTARSLGVMCGLLLLVTGSWQWTPARHTLVALAVGTLTPTPEPTPLPAVGGTSQPVAVVVTATPQPTITPTPTPTPIPPQAGFILVPGRANIRSRPNLELTAIGFVELGDEVLVTGFSDAPNGARWYRLDVPARNLTGVWLLAQVTVQSRAYESVRFEGNAPLRTELQVEYLP